MRMPSRVLLVVMALTIAVNYSIQSECPNECECQWKNSSAPVKDVICRLPYINSQSDFSVLKTKTKSTLFVICDPLRTSELKGFLFKELDTFVGLGFKDCKFQFVPRDTFQGMLALQELVIQNAVNLTFHQESLQSLPRLARLEVSGSQVVAMPNFCSNINLHELNLTSNSFKNVSDAGFRCTNSVFSKLWRIALTNNKIPSFGLEVGKMVPNLKELYFSNGVIESIHSEALLHFRQLRWLDLSNNSIDYVSPYLLRSQKLLKVIGLSRNNLRSIPQGFFGFSTKLKVVALGHTNVDENIWRELSPLRSLEELQLQNNRIKRLEKDALLRFKKLDYLDLSGNLLTQIKNNFFINQSSLENLKLGKNSITVMEKDAFHGLSRLSYLDLNNNNLSFLDDEIFLPLVSMMQLNMSFNSLRSVPSMETMKYLMVLDLQDNMIQTLDPAMFEDLPLHNINLSFNNISHVPRDIFNKPLKLRTVNLANNHIETIEMDAFRGAASLETLSLQNNCLHDITWTFGALKSLKVLDLSHNEILGSIFDGLFPHSLKDINLSFNRFSELNLYAFYKFKRLRKVDIRFNHMTTLKSLALAIYPQLASNPPVFYIAGNRFNCECKLKWLRNLLDATVPVSSQPVIDDLSQVLCVDGFNSQTTFLYEIEPDNMFCAYEDECISSVCPCCEYGGCVCRYTCPAKCSCFRSSDFTTINYVMCNRRNITDIPTHIPSKATKLWLDGNSITLVGKHDFLGVPAVETLYLNNSGMDTIENGSFVGLKHLKVLYLNDNSLTELLYGMLYGLGTVVEIHLENNKLSFIDSDVFEHTPNLEILYLANNRLRIIPESVFTSDYMSWRKLSLSGNPWSCECEFLDTLLQNVYLSAENVTDGRKLECVREIRNETAVLGYSRISNRALFSICSNNNVYQLYQNLTIQKGIDVYENPIQLTLLGCIVAGIFLVCFVFAIAFWQKEFIQLMCFSKFKCRLVHKEDDSRRLYDAFISYSQKDEDIVIRELVPKLEHHALRYKVRAHYRDFPEGASVVDTIVHSARNSRRTVLVVSRNFLEREWCQYDFQTAHNCVLQDKSNKLIVILLNDVNKTNLSADLKVYIKNNTFLKYSDSLFWDKLYFAMPEKKRKVPQVNNQPDVVRTFTNYVHDDEGYETPISRMSINVQRSQSENSVKTDSARNSHIYEEIHPVALNMVMLQKLQSHPS